MLTNKIKEIYCFLKKWLTPEFLNWVFLILLFFILMISVYNYHLTNLLLIEIQENNQLITDYLNRLNEFLIQEEKSIKPKSLSDAEEKNGDPWEGIKNQAFFLAYAVAFYVVVMALGSGS